LDLQTRDISVSRNVFFYENLFRFKLVQPAYVDFETIDNSMNESLPLCFDDPPSLGLNAPRATFQPSRVVDTFPANCTSNSLLLLQETIERETGPASPSSPTAHSDENSDMPSPTNQPAPEVRKSTHLRFAPSHLLDYHCGLIQGKTDTNSKNVKYPISSYLSYEHLSKLFFLF
jgi:hypothetical protein